jgi:hypothetical protein
MADCSVTRPSDDADATYIPDQWDLRIRLEYSSRRMQWNWCAVVAWSLSRQACLALNIMTHSRTQASGRPVNSRAPRLGEGEET